MDGNRYACKTNLPNHFKKLRKPLTLSNFWKCVSIFTSFPSPHDQQNMNNEK